jgi:hypothetical protein
MNSLLELFYDVDEFCVHSLPTMQGQWLTEGSKQRNRARSLHISEVMTLLVVFHQSGYRTFKDFYTRHVLVHLRAEFPGLVSYNRFVEFIPSALVPLCVYLKTCMGSCTGVNYLDSTAIRVCHNQRIHNHKVFAGLARRGKTTMGWFYGFKVHLVVNHRGELLNVLVTTGNTDDPKPVLRLLGALFGKVFGDKGYVSRPLQQAVGERLGIQFITRLRKNMGNVLLLLEDKILLRKRGLIESVIDCLKNECQIEHTRHRSVGNAFAHLVAGLVAYCHRPDKPSICGQRVLKLAA